ncbi:cytochrome P450 [Lampropedia aestuarii]|uniref:cytochrome P450 n=1 Tax=Lampropedia aestuarii TaxID=2562762 RepID=UPI002468EF90|nr:cytochrome P450 [Lampropedia aestuarii]MDH5855734.1 cytochrome P450 [Lampropedia aestuarii]
MLNERFSSDFCHQIYDLAKKNPTKNHIQHHPNSPRVLIIQNLEDADHVMRKNADNYYKNSKWLSQVVGNSRLTDDGEAWKFRQSLSQTVFAKYDADRAFHVSSIHGRNIAKHLAGQPSKSILDEASIHQGMMAIFAQMFLEIEFSDLPMAHDSASKLIELASAYAFTPPGKAMDLADKEHIRAILQLRKTTFDALNRLRVSPSHKSPLLQKMLDAETSGNVDFSFEKELTTLFNAGTDTTSYTLGWGLHILAKQTDLQERLHQAISQLYHQHAHDSQALQTAICQNPLLRGFVAELLRLYPPLPFVSRLALAKDYLSDIEVQPNDVVIISLVGVNHKALQRKDPWVADIDAAIQDGFGMGTGTVSSFVWGKRVCGGRSFALVNLTTVLSELIMQLKLEASSNEQIVYEWVGQMRRKGGQRVRVIAR